MKKFNITISREFGCNSREITRMLASRLGVEMYDRDLVDMAARKAGINLDEFADADKVIDSSVEKLTRRFGYGSSSKFYSDEAIEAQSQVIRDIANKKKSAIFFGRCADYVLREHPNTLNVFLYSSYEARIEHLIKRIDRQRHNYYKYVTGVNRSDRHLKHVMLDVSKFGEKKVVDILYHIVMMEFGE